MGLNSVYRSLQEVFPEIDNRVLRAVAIEHSKDADTAVEVVLTEVIPYLSVQKIASSSSSVNSVAEEGANLHCCGEDKPQVWSADMPSSSSHCGAIGDSNQSCGENGDMELVSLGMYKESCHKLLSSHVNHGLTHEHRADAELRNEDIIAPGRLSNIEVGSDNVSCVASPISQCRASPANGFDNANQHFDWKDFDGPSGITVHGENSVANPYSDDNNLELESSVALQSPAPAQECMPDALTGSLQLVPARCDDFEKSQSTSFSIAATSVALTGSLRLMPTINNDHEKLQTISASDAASAGDTSNTEMVDFEDETALSAVVTRSGQICRIDVLEGTVEDARDSKRTLFSAMKSVIGLMKEVELQEQAAERARDEAARGGLDILTSLEDLKQMLRHAKEANEMHAGEVYGERAILATEVRELQSRLLSLSDERDKALAILDEMRCSLEERLAEAEKVIKIAENERLEKEKYARSALLEQEIVMEKVVEESNILKQEAEENTKLREFLMDRGRDADILQGEISVICKDVKFLKEKFDERLPLSKSLCTSQTSCILASSSSSVESMAPNLVPEQLESCDMSDMAPEPVTEQAESPKIPKETSPESTADGQLFPREKRATDVDRKALVDEGWDFFDNYEFLPL